MQQLREEIIDEVQPVLPRSSVPRAAVIGVAQLADLNVTSSSFETLEEVGDLTFSNKDSSGMESPNICDKLSNDQLQGERREVKKSNAIIVIILLVVLAVMVLLRSLPLRDEEQKHREEKNRQAERTPGSSRSSLPLPDKFWKDDFIWNHIPDVCQVLVAKYNAMKQDAMKQDAMKQETRIRSETY